MDDATGSLLDEVLRCLAQDRSVSTTLGVLGAWLGEEPLAAEGLVVDRVTGRGLRFHVPASTAVPIDAAAEAAAGEWEGVPGAGPLGAGRPGPWDEVLRTGQPIELSSLDTLDPELRREAESGGFSGVLAHPVFVPEDEQPAGVVVAWRSGSLPLSAGERTQLARAVSIAGAVLGRRVAERALARAALVDPLTGLANRRMLDTLSISHPSVGLVAALYVDLDGFKAVNDVHGHASGDQLLEQLARRIAGAVRPSDRVVRLGGDEFLVVCTAIAGPDEAVAIARRIVDLVERPFEASGGAISLSASIGLATIQAGTASLDELIALADKALYQAKAKGKGQWALLDARPATETAPGQERS